MNRRNFFEKSGRWLSAAALGLLGGYLALERGEVSSATCNDNPFCGRCRELSGCRKPQAVEYRSAAEATEPPNKTRGDGKR